MRSSVKEGLWWLASVLPAYAFANVSAANGMLKPALFVAGIIVAVIIVKKTLSKTVRAGKFHGIARPLAVLAIMVAFGIHDSGKKDAVMDYVRQAGMRVDLACKDAGKCPVTLKGFSCDNADGSAQTKCVTERDGFSVEYLAQSTFKPERTVFRITVKLGGYERFAVSGGVEEPFAEGHTTGS